MRIIIIGAGAAGLMAGRELAKAKHEVIILEARDRIGGRIFPLDEEKFGYPAQGGAEFVHGKAPVTKKLFKEAGLTYVPMSGAAEMWNAQEGEGLVKSSWGDDEDDSDEKLLHQKLKELDHDMPIADFLDQNFSGEKFAEMRGWIYGMVQGYDAADPKKISSFSLREEWLGGMDWDQGRVQEGYGAMLKFLQNECDHLGVKILLNQKVSLIDFQNPEVVVTTESGEKFISDKAIVTVALPVVGSIKYLPMIPAKVHAAESLGFGPVIKTLFHFKSRWWIHALGQDLSNMGFLRGGGEFSSWWTQFPSTTPTLTGWIAGPKADKLKDLSEEEIRDNGIEILSRMFQTDKAKVGAELLNSQIINWPKDPLAQGAYSYSTVGAWDFYEELRKPENDRLYFAGEALYHAQETATVEGALGSGLVVAEKILKAK